MQLKVSLGLSRNECILKRHKNIARILCSQLTRFIEKEFEIFPIFNFYDTI